MNKRKSVALSAKTHATLRLLEKPTRHLDYSAASRQSSIDVSRVPRRTMEQLEGIYMVQHHQRQINRVVQSLGLTVGDFEGVPDSDGLSIGAWFDQCKQCVDIVEEVSRDRK